MMVSTKGRYALRVMLDLAMQKQEEYVSLNDIAQRQKISMKYLESIVGMLNKAELKSSMALNALRQIRGNSSQDDEGIPASERGR